mmetsp:Transcript_29258/g.82555  ORF Transcript_29258/g.82555 Transcript_29258/m.82555 type:complete len:501 (+) Transcript_29258:326-1828(+)
MGLPVAKRGVACGGGLTCLGFLTAVVVLRSAAAQPLEGGTVGSRLAYTAYPGEDEDGLYYRDSGGLKETAAAWMVGPQAVRPSIGEVANNRTARVSPVVKQWVSLVGYSPDLADPDPKLSAGELIKYEVQGTGKCLDGSWPAYYMAYGTDPTKWLLFLEGGDWCNRFEAGATEAEREKDDRRNCFERRNDNGELGGSTDKEKESWSLDDLGEKYGYFSNDKERNPLMHTWNKVYVRNCDGSSFTSSKTEPYYTDDDGDDDDDNNFVYLQGHFILESVMADLLEQKYLGHAEEVVIGGCSAGGLAVMLHADKIAGMIRKKAEDLSRWEVDSIKIRAWADSGFFVDNSCGDGDFNYNERMQLLFSHHNCEPGLNPACLAHFNSTGEKYRCMFAENSLNFIQTPMFIAQSLLDGWGVHWIGCDRDDEFKELMKERLSVALSTPRNGGFIDACNHHCHCHETLRINGLNQMEAFQNWYNGGETRIWFSEECKTEPNSECPTKKI